MDESPPEQRLVINAQYIKDFSFENPNAPDVYAALSQAAPEIAVNIDVVPTHLGQRTYEVVLTLRVDAKAGDTVAFLVELDYAGLVTLGPSLPEEQVEPILFSETPYYLFPFARSVLAEVTRDAAFPPLVINPINFNQYYRRHKMNALKASAPSAGTDAEASDSA